MAALAKRLTPTLLVASLALMLIAPAAAAASHESDLLALMNAERAAQGLAPVSMHPDLVDDALAWSQHLMATGALAHNPHLSSVTTNWDRLGENVGLGPTIASLHKAFMDSSSHRRNILGDYEHVGIAVVEETPTKLWVTVVFMKPLHSEPQSTVEDPVPYAEIESTPSPQQPIADAPATEAFRAAAEPVAAPDPDPGPVVALVRHSAQPLPV